MRSVRVACAVRCKVHRSHRASKIAACSAHMTIKDALVKPLLNPRLGTHASARLPLLFKAVVFSHAPGSLGRG